MRASDRASVGRHHNSRAWAHSDVADTLRELDCDPIAGMAKLAQDTTLSIKLRARMLTELATYIAPRRKAVKLSGPNGQPLEPRPAFDMSLLTPEERETLTSLLGKARVGGDR